MTFRIKASMLLGIIVAAALSISGYYYSFKVVGTDLHLVAAVGDYAGTLIDHF